MGVPYLMGMDWNDRARKDAFHYICSERKDWSLDSFFGSGEADFERFVAPVLSRFGFDAREKTGLEIGCGVGRMTRSFSKHFARVLALDVSSEMLKRARELNSDCKNVEWLLGDGQGFSQVPSQSVDYVFSYLVLQHVPTKDLALGHVDEMLRVLKPGGVFCFQFNSSLASTMNWKGRLAWGLLDRLREPVFGLRLEGIGRKLASLAGWDFLQTGRTWRGASLPVRDVLEIVWKSGGTVGAVPGWDTPMTWCCGQKAATPRLTDVIQAV
jgi:SAM-dependent methyltransferase